MNKMCYQCDPDKNVNCPKTMCHRNGGPCIYTTNEEMCWDNIFIDNIMIEDPLSTMLEMQKGFQNRVDPRYRSTDLKERAAFLRDHFVFCDQELQEMLYEIPFFKHWKDYSKMTDQEIAEAYSKAKDELIDAWHFFMNISLGLGMGSNEFYERYMAKHIENIRRQDEGYDHTMRRI